MKTLINLIVAIILVSGLLTGCANDGIGVGNGRGEKNPNEDYLVYRSAAKFTVKYHKSLTLEPDAINPQGHVIIDNRALSPEKESRSSIEFRVSFYGRDYPGYSRTKNLEDHVKALEKKLRADFPKEDWQPVTFSGAKGWYIESVKRGKLKATYYILTTNFDRVVVNIDAQVAGKGMDWVAPIIKTFTHDSMPPVIHEFAVEKNPIEAGKKNLLKFRATDDLSGITDFEGTCASFRLASELGASAINTISVCGFVRALGNDWYGIEFEINEFRAAGEYVLERFFLSDKAENSVEITLRDESYKVSNRYFSYSAANQRQATSVPLLRMTVNNSRPSDSTPPEILAFEMAPALTGQKAQFNFKAKDDISGIASFMGTCGSLRPMSRLDNSEAGISLCGTIAPIPGRPDWYSLSVELNKFRPTDTYVLLSLYLEDRAGNRTEITAQHLPGQPLPASYFNRLASRTIPTSLSIFTVVVTNSGVADLEKPKLVEFSPLEFPIRAGEKGKLRFKAEDNLSGIDNFKGTYSEFVHFEDGRSVHPRQTVGIGGYVIDEGAGWYSIEFEVNSYRPAGEYILQGFSFSDKAGNTLRLIAKLSGDGKLEDDNFYLDQPGTPRTDIKIPRIIVVK